MLEWDTGDDGWDDALDELTSSGGTISPPHTATTDELVKPRRRRLIVLTALLVVLVAAAGIALRWTVGRNVATVHSEVQSVLDQETWALEQGNQALYASLLDRYPSTWYHDQQHLFEARVRQGPFSAEVAELELVRSDLALAEVVVGPRDDPMRRETRAYRQAGQNWRRTKAPADHLWIRQVRRETDDLRFIYHRDDAKHLDPVLPALQALYAQLLTDFNLVPPPDGRELRITLSVQPAEIASVNTNVYYDLSHLGPSPALAQIKRELGTQLAARVLAQFYADADDLAFVLDGIREWEVATWLGEAGYPRHAQTMAQLLERKGFIPLSAVQPQHFDEIALGALAETVIDYLVQREGRQVVNDLIVGVREYDDWLALIGDGLDLRYRDVDAGWWRFVVQRYTLPGDTPPRYTDATLRWMLQLEKQALETQNQELFRALLDPEAPAEWQSLELGRILDRRGPVSVPDPERFREWGRTDAGVWVVAGLDPDHDGLLTVRVRCVRFANDRWYLTSPDSVFTGAPLVTRTQHLEFHYREPDAGLIPQIGRELDELYAQVLQDVGLDPEGRRRVIRFEYSDVGTFSASDDANVTVFPSPQFFGSHDVFRFSLGGFVASDRLAKSFDTLNRPQFSQCERGLAIWEAEQWGAFPQWEVERVRQVERILQQRAIDLTSPDTSPVVYTTMLDYVVTHYGRHRLTDLVQAANDRPNVESLIADVLDVPIEDFKAGWRAYLEETYSDGAS